MKTALVILLALVLGGVVRADPFRPEGWRGYQTLGVTETAGLPRADEPIDIAFSIPAPSAAPALRVVAETGGLGEEVPAQFYGLHADAAGTWSGRVAFLCRIGAKEQKYYRLYDGRPGGGLGAFASELSVRPAPAGPITGPMHWMIENPYYRIETYPKNGQIWHIWNKRGANQIWWFKEWDGPEIGGDPVDWSPNVWVAYPDRVNPSPTHPDKGKKVFAEPFDWHYVVGWVSPQTEIVSGPVFYQIRRWGPVPPHPAHSDPSYDRPHRPIVWAEVTYRFYAGLPWYFQSSVLTTLADMDVYFIRNSQMVFRDSIFSYLAIRPETAHLLPGDSDETCILPLQGHFNRMPFSAQGHTLSDVLPSKFAYYSLFNPENGDAYANFPLLERDSMVGGGEPTMLNHHMSLSEGHNWTSYFARTFDYTNLRFNPENATFLPKGQKFEEANIHLMYHYDGLGSIGRLDRWHRQFQHPLVAQWIPAGAKPASAP